MNQIIVNEKNIVMKDAKITFKEYEALKEQAIGFADNISKIKVTKASVKEAKKELAQVNKDIEALETVRKEIKRKLMEPYEHFAGQVKEIVEIVSKADEVVRNKVRNLEEKERAAKEKSIIKLWDRRNKQYKFSWLTAGEFIRNEHLNKTYSDSKIEKEMVQWFETIDSDLEAIKAMEDSDLLLLEYKGTLNLSAAINNVKQKQKEIEDIREAANLCQKEEDVVNAIVLTSEKDLKAVVNFMNQNNIKYELK